MSECRYYKLVKRVTNKTIYANFEWFSEYFTPEKFEKQENNNTFKIVWITKKEFDKLRKIGY